MTELLFATLIVLLVGAAILGTYPKKPVETAQDVVATAGTVIPLGDRVAAGLFASTLMVSYSYVRFTGAAALVGIAASLPLAYYSFRLARQLWKEKFVRDVCLWLLLIYVLNCLLAVATGLTVLCK